MRRVIALSIATAIVTVIALLIAIPSTDDFDPQNPLWNGLSSFTSEYHLQVLNLVYRPIPPETRVLLIIGPSTPFSSNEIEKLKRFVADGGILVIMDDFGTGVQVLEAMGIRVEVYQGLLTDPLYYYRSYRLPRVEILNTTVVFNYGTALRSWSRGTCIGYSSRFSYLDLDLDHKPDPGEPRGPFCTALEIRYGRGKLIFITDADIAVNAMLSHNQVLLDKLVSGSLAALVSEHWIHKPYTLARIALARAYDVAFNTSARYPIAALAVLVTYLAISRISTAPRREDMCSDREIDRLINAILAKYPSWNREELREIVWEKLCRARSRS